MKSLVIAIILILAFLVACETEDPSRKTSIVMDEGSAIIVSTPNEEQADEQLNFVDNIVQNLTVKHNCYVGQTILLEATVAVVGEFGYILYLETNTDKLWISVNILPAIEIFECEDYYKEGETYAFPLLVEAVVASRDRDWREGDPVSFEVYSNLVITEELEKKLQKAGCRKDK